MALLLTLAEYRDFDDLPSPAETGTETSVSALILVATEIIEKLTGRVFESNLPSPVDKIDTLNGNGTSRIFVRQAPINAVTITEYWDGRQWQINDSVAIPHAFKSGSNLVYFTQGHKFPRGFQNIRITYTYGFDSNLPTELKYTAYLLVKYMVLETERQGIGNQTDGEQTFSYNHKWPPDLKARIISFKTVW